MGSSKNLVVIIGTSNFEMLESRTIWPIEVKKLLYLTVVAWTCYFCNTLDVRMVQGKHFYKSEKSNRLADQDKKAIISVKTLNFIYKSFDKYSLKIKLLYSR